MTPEDAMAEFGKLLWSFGGDRVHLPPAECACPQLGDIPEARRHRAADIREVPLYRELCKHCDPDQEVTRDRQRSQAEILRAAGFEVEHGSVDGSVVEANKQVVAAREVADGD